MRIFKKKWFFVYLMVFTGLIGPGGIVFGAGPTTTSAPASPYDLQDYLPKVLQDADDMVKQKRADAALRYLSDIVDQYSRWVQGNPGRKTLLDDQLPKIYLKLAEVMSELGKPNELVIEAYRRVMSKSSMSCQEEQAKALAWLCGAEPIDKFRVDIKNLCENNKNDGITIILKAVKIVVARESADALPKYFQYIDAVVNQINDPVTFVRGLHEALGQNEMARRTLMAFCRDKPKLYAYAADHFYQQGNYKEAGFMYKDLAARSGLEAEKSQYQFLAFKSQINQWESEKALSELEGFINKYKKDSGTMGKLIPQATMSKGMCLLQMGETEQALATFANLAKEYPGVPEAPGALFFNGYCKVLDGRFAEATEVLKRVVKTYPGNAYADRANNLLTRLGKMKE